MEERRKYYRRNLPARHNLISSQPWIPWKWIVDVHSQVPDPSLITLFDAYRLVYATLDLDRLWDATRPACDVNPCWRCGRCCAYLNPGVVPQEEFLEMARRHALIRRFLRPEPGPPPVPRSYHPWYYRDAPLKMCPLLFLCKSGDRYFCAVHERFCGQRLASCRDFVPAPPHCELPRRPLVY